MSQGPTTWGPARVGLSVLLLFFVLSIEAAILAGFGLDLDSLAGKLALQALLAVTLIVVAFVLAGERGETASPAMLGVRRPHASLPDVVLYLVIAVACYLTFALIWGALVHPKQEDITRDLGVDESTAVAIIAGVLIIVAAPVSEEIFFRGFMFGGLRRRLPFFLAGPIAGAIFGLFHYTSPDTWAVIPQLAVLGFLFTWVYERSGSILPTMLLHAVNNLVAFISLT